MTRCAVPPQGWSCSRQAGHDGPCAASALDGQHPATPEKAAEGEEVLREALEQIVKVADEPRKDWSRHVGDIARTALAARTLAATPEKKPKREIVMDLTSHLVASISLLRKYHEVCAPTKRHALFGTMIQDYEKSAERGRKALAHPATPEKAAGDE